MEYHSCDGYRVIFDLEPHAKTCKNVQGHFKPLQSLHRHTLQSWQDNVQKYGKPQIISSHVQKKHIGWWNSIEQTSIAYLRCGWCGTGRINNVTIEPLWLPVHLAWPTATVTPAWRSHCASMRAGWSSCIGCRGYVLLEPQSLWTMYVTGLAPSWWWADIWGWDGEGK